MFCIRNSKASSDPQATNILELNPSKKSLHTFSASENHIYIVRMKEWTVDSISCNREGIFFLF